MYKEYKVNRHTLYTIFVQNLPNIERVFQSKIGASTKGFSP